ncbi:MAG: type III pantothenate kinase [Phycisphaeraceae bacterium]|nr:type III pantothenate kinase [Phycisphaeraceae bacterium]
MTPDMLLVSIGNTRTRIAQVQGGKLQPSRVMDNADPGTAAAIADAAQAGREGGALPMLLASVNSAAAEKYETDLGRAGVSVMRFGRDVPIPVRTTLEDDSTVGHDRLLDALGAFSRARQACIVIDAGTAVTVDFVDGEGTFHGGVIAPGAQMMLDALHERTSALPAVRLAPEGIAPGPTPFGKTTPQAMTLGVSGAVRGLVHDLIDRYAEFYGAYPRVIATGGDAALLFEGDELVEHIVPDLTLIGMHAAAELLEQIDEVSEE